MTGFLGRLSQVFKHVGADEAVNPGALDELARVQDEQVAVLQQVRRSIAAVAAARRDLAAQLGELATDMDQATEHARRALAQGREDLATEALRHKAELGVRLAESTAQHDQLQLQEERLVLTSGRLQAKLDAFRTRQAAAAAAGSAAEASARADEALGALGGEVRAAADHAAAAQRVLAATADPAGVTEIDLDAHAARELDAMRAEQSARPPIDPDAGSYTQPGAVAGGGVQDSFHAETPEVSR